MRIRDIYLDSVKAGACLALKGFHFDYIDATDDFLTSEIAEKLFEVIKGVPNVVPIRIKKEDCKYFICDCTTIKQNNDQEELLVLVAVPFSVPVKGTLVKGSLNEFYINLKTGNFDGSCGVGKLEPDQLEIVKGFDYKTIPV